MDQQVEAIIDHAWYNFESSNKYAALCKKLAAYKVDVDDIILAFLETIEHDALKKELIYELIDNHSSRPGHDLRYSLSPNLLKSLGWEPKIILSKRIEEVVDWSLKNKRWLS